VNVILKSVVYRISSILIVQLITWVLFRTIYMNLLLILLDSLLRTTYYYTFEKIWDKIMKK